MFLWRHFAVICLWSGWYESGLPCKFRKLKVIKLLNGNSDEWSKIQFPETSSSVNASKEDIPRKKYLQSKNSLMKAKWVKKLELWLNLNYIVLGDLKLKLFKPNPPVTCCLKNNIKIKM